MSRGVVLVNRRSFKQQPAKRARRKLRVELAAGEQRQQSQADDPTAVGPAHLLARHRARLAAVGSASPGSSGDPGGAAAGDANRVDCATSGAVSAVLSGAAARLGHQTGAAVPPAAAPVTSATTASAAPLPPQRQGGSTSIQQQAVRPPARQQLASDAPPAQPKQMLRNAAANGCAPGPNIGVKQPGRLEDPGPAAGPAAGASRCAAGAPAQPSNAFRPTGSGAGSGTGSGSTGAAAGLQQQLLDYHARLKGDLATEDYTAVVKAVRTYK